jgi:hypothetical protein
MKWDYFDTRVGKWRAYLFPEENVVSDSMGAEVQGQVGAPSYHFSPPPVQTENL